MIELPRVFGLLALHWLVLMVGELLADVAVSNFIVHQPDDPGWSMLDTTILADGWKLHCWRETGSADDCFTQRGEAFSCDKIFCRVTSSIHESIDTCS